MAFIAAAIPALLGTTAAAGTAAVGAGLSAGVGIGGSAVAGAAASSSLLGTLSTVASVAGTAFSAFSSYQSSRYQAAILKRNAQIERDNAVREQFRGQIDQQETDFNALYTIGRAEAQQGASGFSTSSASLARRRRLNRVLARSDALRVRQDAATGAHNAELRAGGYQAEAQGARQAGNFALASGGLEVGNTLLNRAALVNSRRARRINTVGS